MSRSRVLVVTKMLLQRPRATFESVSLHPPPRYGTSTTILDLWLKRFQLYVRRIELSEEQWAAELLSLLDDEACISCCITIGARKFCRLWSHNSKSETPVFSKRQRVGMPALVADSEISGGAVGTIRWSLANAR